MRSVSIIGAGCTPFGEHWDRSFRELAVEAGTAAIKDSGVMEKSIESLSVGCMASGRLVGQEHVGALVADQLGLNPIPASRHEAACASGSVALRAAYQSIASGTHECALVLGVEKMTEVSTDDVSTALGGAGDQETELFHGATFPALYALLARAHMQAYGTTEEQMAAVSVKNHANAAQNPFAQFQKPITIEQVLHSAYVASPLKLLDCSPITDGAAAMVLMESTRARKFSTRAIEIIGSAQASDSLALTGRSTLTGIPATQAATRSLLLQSKLKLSDISFTEVHDCFTIAEIMATEDIGFFKKGAGGPAALEGKTARDGNLPINTSGGLKGKGHPVGATGIAQAIEAFLQLNGEAGSRQLDNPKTGLTHNVGGSGATVVMHAFRKLR